MKITVKNTTKLLLFLYGAELSGKKMVEYAYVHRLFPHLSASGRRSLVSSLKGSQFLLVEDFDSTKQLFITTYGKTFLETEFPALSSEKVSWDGTWSMLLFIESPKADPNFRYLRQLLVDTHAGQLSRGVYLYPGRFHKKVEEQYDFYRNCIVVTSIKEWQFGDERSVIVPLFNLSDVKDSLSGVSSEVDDMLVISNGQKGSISSLEDRIHLVFDRLVAVLEFDVGVHKHYFPQVENSREILTRLCQI